MLETLYILPVGFWVVVLLLLGGAGWAGLNIREGIGLPMLAVMGTATAWYVGDAFYNDYAHHHATLFTSAVLASAWWQVALFVLVFLSLAPLMHVLINGRERQRTSQIYQLMQTGAVEPMFQFRLQQLFSGTAMAWAVLVIIASIRLGDQLPYYFFPFLGYKADPWGRGQVGVGMVDALLALATYFQMYLAAMFGVVVALAQNRRLRLLALICCCLIWPGYIFDRTRNYILAVVMPGLLAWVFVRMRGSWLEKGAVLAGLFFLVNAWMAFVIANRSETTIVDAFRGGGVSVEEADKEAHHEGLNMFEELCWINTFIETGTYRPNRGARYFDELVNPIPRGLWHDKPMIGLDYAVARGQELTDTGSTSTVSTGMIGQGVVNFGRVLGPVFAAWLMACWAALLARLDLRGEEMGNIPLYALGMILTFNLGRDITLITLYTFFFGMALVWILRRRAAGQPMEATARRARNRRPNREAPPTGTAPAPLSPSAKP